MQAARVESAAERASGEFKEADVALPPVPDAGGEGWFDLYVGNGFDKQPPAVVPPLTRDAMTHSVLTVTRADTLPGHLAKVIARLTTARAGAEPAVSDTLGAIVRELDRMQGDAARVRGDAREALVGRLRELDDAMGRVLRESMTTAQLEALLRASDVEAPMHLINPYSFDPPIAPHVAAALEGVKIDMEVIARACDELTRLADVVIVEGAGGFMIPLNATRTSAELTGSPDAIAVTRCSASITACGLMSLLLRS